MRAPMAAIPASMRINVEGSGTGVKLRSSALPFSEKKKLPPLREFWKPLVLTEKSSELNPEIEPALTKVHEYGCDELKFDNPPSPLPGSIDLTAIMKREDGVALIVNAPVTFTVS
jgi:hypothetical protein